MDYLKQFETNLAYHFSEILNIPLAKPYWIYISLSHKCTYNCQMCGVVKILKEYELPTEVVKKALNEISNWGWDCVVMFTGGEPFLRDDIFELINYSVKRNLKTEIVSNGALISRELAYRIISSGLQNIAISLDGAKESTHDFIRKEGSFEKATNAIRSLVEAKREIGYGPQISVWTTIMKENVEELYEIIFLAKDLGVECLVYHPVIVSQDDMQNPIKEGPFWVTGDRIEVLKQQIDKIVDYQKKNGLVAFLHDPYLWLKYFQGTLTKEDWKCNPFAFIDIGPNGYVRSCGSSFGNVIGTSLATCLNTIDAKMAWESMQKCQEPCLQTCWARPEADSLIDIVKNFLFQLNRFDGNDEEKRKMIEEGFGLLTKYEELIYQNY